MVIFHSYVSLPESIPFLWLNIPRCLVKSRLTPSFVWSVSMLKPFKPQILTQPQLRQLQPVLKGFAVFLACSWQSSWANVGVCGDVYIYIQHVICAYIYISISYNSSQTWNKEVIWGWFPILTVVPVRWQWGRYTLLRTYTPCTDWHMMGCVGVYIYIYICSKLKTCMLNHVDTHRM